MGRQLCELLAVWTGGQVRCIQRRKWLKCSKQKNKNIRGGSGLKAGHTVDLGTEVGREKKDRLLEMNRRKQREDNRRPR